MLQARTLHSPREPCEGFKRELLGDVFENTLGHGATTGIALRHEKHFQFLLRRVLVQQLLEARVSVKHSGSLGAFKCRDESILIDRLLFAR